MTEARTPSGAPAANARAETDSLLSRARVLEAELSSTVGARQETSEEESLLSDAARRLRRSVIRPLEEMLERDASGKNVAPEARGPHAGGGGRPQAKDAGDRGALLTGEPLWQLAKDATRIRLMEGLPTEVQEATAALQDLACQFDRAEADGRASRLAELRAIQADLPCGIESQANGPYLVTNVENW
jgi:hypothetical protein